MNSRKRPYSLSTQSIIFKKVDSIIKSENSSFILDGDKVYIKSRSDKAQSFFGAFLHGSELIEERRIIPTQIGSDNKINSNNKRELNVATDKKTEFTVRMSSSYQKDLQDVMKIGDTFWINFSEQNMSLVSQSSFHGKEKKLIFEPYEPNEANKRFLGNSNGLFRIENYKDCTKGGLLTWKGTYLLKHVS